MAEAEAEGEGEWAWESLGRPLSFLGPKSCVFATCPQFGSDGPPDAYLVCVALTNLVHRKAVVTEEMR